MKRLRVLLAVGLVFSLLFVLGQSGVYADKLRVGMVTDVGGLGDQSFNDAAWRGLQKAADDFGVKVNVVESNTMNDYIPNLTSLAEQGYDMVWAIGFLMTDAVNEVAAMYPDTNFGIIDAQVDQSNVASVTFKEQEGSFLVGVIAGLMTEKDKVGFIGGMESPLIQKFEAGYVAGVKAVNKDAKIVIGYTGAFDNPGAGKELALTQFNQGADIIYHASGACGIGVIKAAEEKGLYAIGVDSPQAHLAPYNVLTSMLKRVDVAVYNEVKDLSQGSFKAGHKVYGLAEDGVGYSDQALAKVPPKYIKIVNDYKEKIINGKIEVPTVPEK